MFTLVEAAELIRTCELSPVGLTSQCIREIEQRNQQVNAFITVTAELAIQQAAQAQREIAAGNCRGPLHGIPIALKDNIDLAGVPTTAASEQLRNQGPRTDSTLVALLKQAGAVIVGKTNLHEFAFGGSGIISAFGPVSNPHALDHITGGSSSGSAAAVAAGMCVAAIGTDTAGSVRCPAALCGVVGHRPSQGWFSNSGIVPLSPSLDTAGPITRTVRDAAVILSVLAPLGYPPCLVSPAQPEDLLTGVKLAVAGNLAEDVEPEVASAFKNAVKELVRLGASVDEVTLAWESPMTVRRYEIYAYHREMLAHTPELYQPATRERIAASQGIDEWDYLRALDAMQKRARDLRIFESFDAVLSPTVPVTAPALTEVAALDHQALRQYEMQRLLRNTVPFSTLWWPTVSVPCGLSEAGLPIGLQISARPGSDHVALRIAQACERNSEGSRITSSSS